MKFEVWLHYDCAANDVPGDDVHFKIFEGDSRAEAERFIESRYEDGRYHAETYEVKEVTC